MSTPSLFITGATGFVGSHLTKLLVNCGFRVSAMYRRDLPINKGRVSFAHSVEWVDKEVATDWIRSRRPDVIVHVATDYSDCSSSSVDTNILMPLRLLEAAEAAGSSLFINTDSFFGKASSNYQHMKAYTMSKGHFAAWGRYFASCHSVHFLTMRLEHVYGEYDNENKFVPSILRRLRTPGEQIKLTSGDQRRDFIHVSDVARAFLTVIKDPDIARHIEELEVGSGKSVTVRSFVERAHVAAGACAVLNFGALPQRPGEIMSSTARNESLLNLGWRPIVDLDEGIERTLKWLEAEEIDATRVSRPA